MKIKLTKAVKSVSGGVTRFTPEDASKVTGAPCSLFCEVNGSGDPILDGSGSAIYWYFTPDDAPQPAPVPPVAPKDMTDAQIASDPLFPLIARAIKERRKSGPTSKRPKDLTVDDRGFCYWNTDRKAPEYWHITGKWFDAMGAALP